MATRPVALAISGERRLRGNVLARRLRQQRRRAQLARACRPAGKSYAQTLAIAPGDPTLVYAGFAGSKARGLYKSTDAGRSWQHLTDGLEDTDIDAVALDPTHPTTIYIGTGSGGVFKSTDGGTNWRPASSGLPRIR